MKDPYRDVREKEQDVERVHKEIQALLSVIPLISTSKQMTLKTTQPESQHLSSRVPSQ